MSSFRIRLVIWSLLAIAFGGWWIRSYQVCDEVVSPLGYERALTVYSLRGTVEIVVSRGSSWILVPLSYWEVPVSADGRHWSVKDLKLGLSTSQDGPDSSYHFYWPIPLPLLLLFLGVEGPAWLKRKRAKSASVSETGAGDVETEPETATD